MSIEFRCTQCGKLLRTKDETAGKQAKCPDCGALVPIPLIPTAPVAAPISTPQPSAQYAPPSTATGSVNPYQAPASAPARSLRPLLDRTEAKQLASGIFKRNRPLAFSLVLAAQVTQYVVGEILYRGIFPAMEGGTWLSRPIFRIVYLVFGFWISVGLLAVFLKLARGGKPAIPELFGQARHIVTFAIASILFGIAAFLGSALLIVPGIIVSLMLSQFGFLIVDKNSRVTDSLAESRQLMVGNKWALFSLIIGWSLLIGIAPYISLWLANSEIMPYELMEPAVRLVNVLVLPWLLTLLAVCYLIVSGQRSEIDSADPATPTT